MRQMLNNLWNDDCGAMYTVEILFYFTIVILALIVAFRTLAGALKVEFIELSQSIMALNQSYSFSGESTCESFVVGSAANDISQGAVGAASTSSGSGAGVQQAFCD